MSTWISHGCTCVPPSWNPFPPPSPPYPSGLSQSNSFGCPASAALRHALNLHWPSILYMVICMFQCYFSSHPTLAFSHTVRKSVYICVSFAALHIMSSLLSFWIPYICVNILCWCWSFWLTSLCIIGSSFIHLIITDPNAFLFIAE